MNGLTDEDGLRAIRVLINKTRENTLSWSQPWDDSDDYTASTPRFSYYVKSRDNDGAAPFEFQIWRQRSEGQKNVKVYELETVPGASTNTVLEELHALAAASALGIGDVKQDLFDDLR